LRFFKSVVQGVKQNWFWLKWFVALSLLGCLFYSTRVQLVELWVRRPNWPDLAIALLIVGASILLTFYRWYLLVWAQEFPFTVRDAMRLGIVGYACNFVMPGSAGGDIVKAGMIAAEQNSRKLVAAATVLLDRILGVLALFMVGSLATFFQPMSLLKNHVAQVYLAVLWTGAVGGIVGLAILLHPAVPRSRLMQWMVRLPKVGPTIGGLVNAVLLYQARRRVLVVAVLISIAGHFGMLSGFYFCAKAVQAGPATPGYWAHLLLVPGAEVGAVFIPVPAGLGAFEGLMAKGYQIANEAAGSPVTAEAAAAAGVATTLAYRVTTIVIAIIGAPYYFMSRREIERALRAKEDSEPEPEPKMEPDAPA
jgi:glycosyltransferase 2 family protein